MHSARKRKTVYLSILKMIDKVAHTIYHSFLIKFYMHWSDELTLSRFPCSIPSLSLRLSVKVITNQCFRHRELLKVCLSRSLWLSSSRSLARTIILVSWHRFRSAYAAFPLACTALPNVWQIIFIIQTGHFCRQRSEILDGQTCEVGMSAFIFLDPVSRTMVWKIQDTLVRHKSVDFLLYNKITS